MNNRPIKKHSIPYSFLGHFLVLITLFATSCHKEPVTPENNNTIVIFHGAMSGNDTNSRTMTSVEGNLPGNAISLWEAGDFIYVVDGSNVYKSRTLTQSASTADFQVEANEISSETPSVYYAGCLSNTHNQVNIAVSQQQSAPNNSQHLGRCGDCGYAEAVKGSNGEYSFTLSHKSSVICFKPWVDADLTSIGLNGSSIKLKSIIVTSTTNIAGDYTLSASGLTELGNLSNTIELTCGEGFTLANTKDESQSAAGSYMVIAPSTSNITIKYVIEYYHIIPSDGDVVALQNTIVRSIEDKEFEPGKMYTINCHITTADLEYVDLGNGTQTGYENIELGKWGVRNVGETTDGTTETAIITPELPGGYYDWGATVSLTDNDMSNTLWSEPTPFGWVNSISSGQCLTDIGHDVARNLWGDSWRMPTEEEITNLCYGASWELAGTIAPSSTIGYIAGYKITGSNGNSIYLPAAGYRYPQEYTFVGRLGWYWSSTIAGVTSGRHLSMWLDDRGYDVGDGWRDVAQSIRPVHE